MVVKYVAYNWEGQRVEGVLNVEREEDAARLLEQENLIPYRLETVQERPSLRRFLLIVFTAKPQEFINFTRGVAALLKAGIPLRESLRILGEQTSDMVMKEVVRQLISDVESGDRFSVACSRFPRVFPSHYLSLLRVAEATGDIADSMDELADGLEKSKSVRDKVKGALVYPAFTAVAAIAVAIIMIKFSLPALVGLLSEFGGELPFTTRLLITFSDATQGNTVYMFAGVFGIPTAIWAYTRTPQGSRVRDRLMLKLPVVGKVIERLNLFMMTSTMSSLLDAGIPPIEALRLTKDSLTNVVYRERLDRVTEETTGGTRLGLAFRDHWPTPPVLAQAVMMGETWGTLVTSLASLGV